MTAQYTALWCYPWDLLDEGLDVSLGRIADAGLDAISLAVSYHAGMVLLPHNPKTRLRLLEDGSLYFPPIEGAFRGLAIQPRLSQLTEGRDSLALIVGAAQKLGLAVVAWTVCNHNSYQGTRHPDLCMQTALGDRLTYALCPAQPAVQAYLRRLMGALGGYSLRALQLESYGYSTFPHGHHHEKLLTPLGPLGERLMAVCFCPACQRAAEEAGVDWRAPRDAIAATLGRILRGEADAAPSCLLDERLAAIEGLPAYLDVQRGIVEDLVISLAEATTVPLNLLGIEEASIGPLKPHIAEVSKMAYRDDPLDVAAVSREAQRRLAGRTPLSIGLDLCPASTPTPEALQAKLNAARASADAGVYVYNYGLMPLRSLDWLGRAIRGA